MTKNNYCFLLIRGLLREQRHWGGFNRALQNQFPEAKILMLDIPGNGLLNQQTSPDSIHALTESLRQQLAKHPPLTLISLSMGGMIALDWMNRYADEIDSAILINSSISNFSPFFHRLQCKNYPAIIRMLFQKPVDREKSILSMTSNKQADNLLLLDQWRQWQKQNPVSSTSAINQLKAAASFSVQTKPQHPVLLLCSQTDRLVNHRCSLTMQHHWQTDCRIHESAGHDLPLDDPRWVINETTRWLKKNHPNDLTN